MVQGEGMKGLLHTEFPNLVRIVISLALLVSGIGWVAVSGACSTERGFYDVSSYGAGGRGLTDDTAAINGAIKACAAAGGGSVILRAGVYKTGTIFLQDRVSLDIEEGATLLASERLSDYYQMPRSSESRNTALILAENVHDVAIVGHGIIDGNGRSFIDLAGAPYKPSFNPAFTRQGQAWLARMQLAREGPVCMKARPGVLILALHVNGLRLENFHVVDSPNWTIKVGGSRDIKVKNLDVRNNVLIPNNDALDISTSRNASISNCYLEAGDDALVIGGPCTDGWCQEPTERISVNNVILSSRSAAIRIGPAAKSVRDLSFNNVIVRDSNRGILINARADENVHDISFSNMSLCTRLIDGPWWGAGEPIAISVAGWDYMSWAKRTRLGYIRNVRFSGIVARSDSPIVVYGMQPGHISNITLNDLSLDMVPDALNVALGGNLDLQPTSPPADWGVKRCDLSAILAHNIDNLKLTNVRVRWCGSFPEFYTHALSIDGFAGLEIRHFFGSAAVKGLPVVCLKNRRGAHTQDAGVELSDIKCSDE